MTEPINWITGHAIKRLLVRGPAAKYYMGLKDKPGVIFDVAYSPEETIEIGAQVFIGMKLKSMTDITSGALSEKTAASLYYIVQKYYPKPEMDQRYRIQIGAGNYMESFDEWCIRVKGRLYRKAYEKIEWWQEWQKWSQSPQ